MYPHIHTYQQHITILCTSGRVALSLDPAPSLTHSQTHTSIHSRTHATIHSHILTHPHLSICLLYDSLSHTHTQTLALLPPSPSLSPSPFPSLSHVAPSQLM